MSQEPLVFGLHPTVPKQQGDLVEPQLGIKPRHKHIGLTPEQIGGAQPDEELLEEELDEDEELDELDELEEVLQITFEAEHVPLIQHSSRIPPETGVQVKEPPGHSGGAPPQQ